MEIQRKPIAIVLALVVTCLFGRMAWFASTGAFENADPTPFQKLENVWTVLYWMTPAVLIGLCVRRHVLPVAGAVNLVASLILLACAYPSLIPVGSRLPHPPGLLLPMAAEVASGIPFGMVLALIVATIMNKESMSKMLLAIVLVPVGVGIAWAGNEYFTHRSALALWLPERALLEAAADIKARSLKIYLHGSFSAYAVGVEDEQRSLIQNLPRADAGGVLRGQALGCFRRAARVCSSL